MKTFLLHFEEAVGLEQDVSPELPGKISAGTKTLTEVRREEVDDDPQSMTSNIFPRKPGLKIQYSKTGTVSVTAVRAEEIDFDPKDDSLGAFPK